SSDMVQKVKFLGNNYKLSETDRSETHRIVFESMSESESRLETRKNRTQSDSDMDSDTDSDTKKYVCLSPDIEPGRSSSSDEKKMITGRSRFWLENFYTPNQQAVLKRAPPSIRNLFVEDLLKSEDDQDLTAGQLTLDILDVSPSSHQPAGEKLLKVLL